MERRKLVSMTRSPSVAVVSEIAPIWMTASSLRPLSQSISSPGGTTSASCRLARFRHLPLAQISPFAVMPKEIGHNNIGAAGVIQRRHDIRSDKTSPPGHQQHKI